MTVLRSLVALAQRGWAGRMTYRFAWVVDAFGIVVFLASLYYVSRLVPPEMVAGSDWFTMTALGVGVYAFLGGLAAGPRGFLLSEIGYGTLEILLTLGPPLRSMVAAATVLQILRGLGRLLVLFAVAAFFGWTVEPGRVLALVPVLAVASLSGIGVGLFQGALDLRMRRVGRMMALSGGLGAILSGVYFPVAFLPAPLRALAEILPTTHAIRAGRALLMGHGDVGPSLLVLSLLAAVLLPLGLWSFRAAIRAMREDGSFLTP